ncbi:hypothetical protein QZM64_39940 [Burkholderia cepacia]|uniref:hypothetical protein n=1 Tax=Burkholderia cepacia complex TaxID=87882 RepID=UPI000D002BA4|nr:MULTISPECIES: hypothetical protein [Burkholderia cepacia complex]MDN7445343.1 hypothetical protein [Burkholderia cepacia]PRD92216.1 hypothetical protein C6P88_16285 [Burkholderia contaminans]
MFDDFSSWDGLNVLGMLSFIAGCGVCGYVAFALGFQNGLDAASQCATQKPRCAVQVRQGWFGIEYKSVRNLPEK